VEEQARFICCARHVHGQEQHCSEKDERSARAAMPDGLPTTVSGACRLSADSEAPFCVSVR